MMSIYNDEINKETVVFGGGCFWCTEAIFKMLKGVILVEPGYAGGTEENPTHEEVASGTTGHAEVVRIKYYPEKISFEKLLEVFFATHDPTTKDAQGADRGSQYRSLILYTTDEQKKIARKFIEQLNYSLPVGKHVVTEVVALGPFFPAKNWHRDYYENNIEDHYCRVVIDKKLEVVKNKFSKLLDKKASKEIHRDKVMTAEQHDVMVNRGTERPFTGKYLHETKEGTYNCSVCENPLFRSSAKFDSGTGWPSFDQAIEGSVKQKQDGNRTEIVCAECESHLGHVFDDGPTKTKKRYCINSVCLDLKSKK